MIGIELAASNERIDLALQTLPSDWRELQAEIEPQYGALYDKESYGLA